MGGGAGWSSQLFTEITFPGTRLSITNCRHKLYSLWLLVLKGEMM